jgi:hypothetical protein
MKKKFNKFDLIIVVILLVVGAAVVFKVLEFTGTDNGLTTKSIKLELMVEDVRQVTVDNIQVGDVLYAQNTKEMVGKVIDKKVTPFEATIETQDGKMVITEVPNKYKIHLTIDATGYVTDRGYIVGGFDFKVGKVIAIESKQVSTTGIVWKIQE